jgi:hypothetical protein
MPHPALNVSYGFPSIALVPAPIESLSCFAELDGEVPGQVLGFKVAAFLLPQAQEGRLVDTHDDPRIGSSDEEAPISGIG